MSDREQFEKLAQEKHLARQKKTEEDRKANESAASAKAKREAFEAERLDEVADYLVATYGEVVLPGDGRVVIRREAGVVIVSVISANKYARVQGELPGAAQMGKVIYSAGVYQILKGSDLETCESLDALKTRIMQILADIDMDALRRKMGNLWR